jgi:hypothetical protein
MTDPALILLPQEDRLPHSDARAIAPWLRARTVADFADDVRLVRREPPGALMEPVPASRNSLADLAISFHKKSMTLTAAVEEGLTRFRAGNPAVRVAHQPNFLPSLNVAGQAAVSVKMAHLLPNAPSQVFFLLDYDVNTDRRYRHALLPSLSSRDGQHTLSAPPTSQQRPRLSYTEAAPDQAFLNRLIELLHEYSTQDLALIRKTQFQSSFNRRELAGKSSIVAGHLRFAFGKAATLAEANSMFLSRIVNLELGLPTIFLPGAQALLGITDHVLYLWERVNEYYEACDAAIQINDEGDERAEKYSGRPSDRSLAPFWAPCAADGSRVALHWDDDRYGAAVGICPACSRRMRITSRTVSAGSQDGRHPVVIPRVIWDDLLDGFAWNYVAGCSYRGGREHYRLATRVAALMRLPLLPEFFSHAAESKVPTTYRHIAEQCTKIQRCGYPSPPDETAMGHISSGRGSIVHSMLWESSMDLRNLADRFTSSPSPS